LVAIISIAIHHVQDPADLLKRLRRRVKLDSLLVMIDWLQPSEEHAAARKDELGVARLPKIWPDFSTDAINLTLLYSPSQ
jgi:ubiquinone/menaquinone biosynthesis C-methylase UbiE